MRRRGFLESCFAGVAGAAGLTDLALGAEEENPLDSLVGQAVDLETSDDRYWPGVVIEELVRAGKAVTGLKTRVDGEARTFAAKEIAELYVDGAPWDVALNKQSKSLEISAAKRSARLDHEAEVEQRLAGTKHKLWPRTTAALHAQAMEDLEKHVAEVRTVFPDRPFEVLRTRFYLVCSDLPAEDSEPMLKVLDKLYDALAKGFGIPAGKNVWYGQCLVHAFRRREDYLAWEEHYYKNGNTTSGGRAHWNYGTGRVIVTVAKQKNPHDLHGLLAHETTYGLIHRFHSNRPAPSWLRLGVCEWASSEVVPEYVVPRKKQAAAIAKLRETGTIPFALLNEEAGFDGDWQGGFAGALVRFLHGKDARKYRDFWKGVKEGRSGEESLQATFRWDYTALLTAFGAKIGVPKLRRMPS
jgi:hypothetical protein